MKNALDWIKSNPISAVSILVSLVGVVVFVYVVFVAAPGLRARVVEENSQQASALQQFTNNSIDLPNPNPNEPPIQVGPLVINEQVIAYVEGVYNVVRMQSSEITGRTMAINSQAHVDYTLAGGRLFGTAEPQPSLFVEAKRDYRNSFEAMFTDEYDSLRMPRIAAGMPPTPAEVEDALVGMLETYLDSVGADDTGDLTQAQAEELYKLQQVAVMSLLADRARSITLYADVMPLPIEEAADGGGLPGGVGQAGNNTNTGNGMDRYSVNYPFTIADWAFAPEQPALDQIWEGQLQLWITRDIMQAIANTNSIPQRQPDGTVVYVPDAVIDAPVKRLLRLEVVPGYVGLHSGGAVNAVAGSGGGNIGTGGAGVGGAMPGAVMSQSSPGSRGRGGAAPGRGGVRGGATPGGRGPSGVGSTSIGDDGVDDDGDDSGAAVNAQQAIQVSELYGKPSVATLPEPNQPLIDSFFFGPTGRFSNTVFDVRHVKLTLHIEWEALPVFFEQLRQVNFMTVIDMKVRDIDEYGAGALADGFVYGEGDIVEVEMSIETLWFRSWTEEIMPQIVKDALAIPRR